MRKLIPVLLLTLLAAHGVQPGHAQPHDAEGVLHAGPWPEAALQAPQASLPKALRAQEILPFLDTLSFGYRYRIHEGAPRLEATLAWVPGSYGVLDGERAAAAAFPEGTAMVALAFVADVYTGDKRAARAFITVDSMGLRPAPAVHHATFDGLTWDNVFANASPRQARRLFARGFTLRNLRLVSVAYAAPGVAADAYAEGSVVDRVVHAPPRRTLYTIEPLVNVSVRLAWLFGGGRRIEHHAPPADRPPRADRGRGAQPEDHRGRLRGTSRDDADAADDAAPAAAAQPTADADNQETRATGRAAAKDTSKKKGRDRDDEEEDDDTLLPVALTAVAAVGAIAYAGGTVGYFGNAATAPIGLASGYVNARGGLLLQAGINAAVLHEDAAEPEHLLVRAHGFYDLFGIPLQPAVGAGVLAAQHGDALTLRPSFSLGLAGNFGPLLVLGGYDVALGGAEFGLAFNFRGLRRGER